MARIHGPQLINVYAGTQQEAYIRRLQLCDLIARIWLCEGWSPLQYLFKKSFNSALIKKYWQFTPPYPFPSDFRTYTITTKYILWYIHTHIVPNTIWNGSFYYGFSQIGKIHCHPQYLPYALLWTSKRWETIAKTSPLPIMVQKYSARHPVRWRKALPLMLPHDENSLSFMAGVLAVGVPVMVSNVLYASYPKPCEKWFRQWNIPIERVTAATKKVNHPRLLIAPFWPAMLEAYMPRAATGWLVQHDLSPQSVLYASILWCIYRHEPFHKVNMIPYLPASYVSFELFKTDELSRRKNLERKWVEHNLTNLDGRFKKIVIAVPKHTV